jgi:hypothetical protein
MSFQYIIQSKNGIQKKLCTRKCHVANFEDERTVVDNRTTHGAINVEISDIQIT